MKASKTFLSIASIALVLQCFLYTCSEAGSDYCGYVRTDDGYNVQALGLCFSYDHDERSRKYDGCDSNKGTVKEYTWDSTNCTGDADTETEDLSDDDLECYDNFDDCGYAAIDWYTDTNATTEECGVYNASNHHLSPIIDGACEDDDKAGSQKYVIKQCDPIKFDLIIYNGEDCDSDDINATIKFEEGEFNDGYYDRHCFQVGNDGCKIGLKYKDNDSSAAGFGFKVMGTFISVVMFAITQFYV